MTNTDIDGSPILIIGVEDVVNILEALDIPPNSCQNTKGVKKLWDFIQTDTCQEWLRKKGG